MQCATYCPEDNKLRLYVGRVPRDEYERLRAEGWTSTPKQDCDFVAVWTPQRRDTALEYSDLIEDEDMGPEDRAADRAERFGEYRDKRSDEATGHADHYDSGPRAHGFQNERRAERAAARHDRIADRACDAWGKAEYWQRRTAGVISHALHVCSPSVRMGRIKTLEAEQRKQQASIAEYQRNFFRWKQVAALDDPERQQKLAVHLANHTCHGSYFHPRPASVSDYVREHGTGLWSLLTHETDPITGAEAAALYLAGLTDPDSAAWEATTWMQWARHYELRLAYENQMLEAQGGRAAFVEMEVGGFLGQRQIHKVNKSNVTGRVVSVHVKGPKVQGWTYKAANVPGTDYALYQIDTERLPEHAYRSPTDEERLAFFNERDAAKAAAKKTAPEKIPLVNPADADADRLQALWNERAKVRHDEARKAMRVYGDFEPAKVTRCPQSTYSAASKGSYGRAETRGVCRDGELMPRFTGMYSEATEKRRKRIGAPVCNLRITSGGNGYHTPDSIIVLTDKPQKPLPAEVWEQPFALEAEAIASLK